MRQHSWGDRIGSNYESDYWKNFWSGKRDAGHRSSSESFLYNEAGERLFHLGGGKSIIDVGCGTCDMLAYYARHYDTAVGADFAPSMLEAGRQRLDQFNLDHVELIEADEQSIWTKLDPGPSSTGSLQAGLSRTSHLKGWARSWRMLKEDERWREDPALRYHGAKKPHSLGGRALEWG